MKKKLLLLFKGVVSLLAIYLVYSRINFSELGDYFGSIHVASLLILYILFLFNTVISSCKWQVLLHADDIHVPLPTLVRSYLVGTFFNLFLPSNIGGDAYRVIDIGTYSKKSANSFASVFADRLSGFLALTILGLVFALVGYTSLPDQRILFIPLGIFVLILAITWGVCQEKLFQFALKISGLKRFTALENYAHKFSSTFQMYLKKPALLAKVMAISFVFQFVVICAIYVLAGALRLEIPFVYFLVFVPVISFIEALPISIYGLGVRDAAYVFFFAQAGVSESAAAAMALLYLIFTVFYSLQGGILLWFRTGARNKEEPGTAQEAAD